MIITGIVMMQHKVDSILIFPAGTASLSAISANCAIEEAVGAAAANSEISNTLFVWGNLNVIPVSRTQTPRPFCCTVVCTRAKFCAQKNAAVPAAAKKGGASLFKKRCPSLKPSQRKFYIASEQLEELQCLPIALPARGGAALGVAIRFVSASIIRCRSADLVEVEPNFRLPPVSTMRRALAMPHSAGSLPPCYRHSRLTVVRHGCYW